MSALERYNAAMEGELEPDPVERLRFFLSLALIGQDWIDVEQFLDGVSKQLAESQAREAQLRDALEKFRDNVLFRIGSTSPYRQVAQDYFYYIKPLLVKVKKP